MAEYAGEGAVRIRDADLDRLERHLFRRYPNREWGTFFRFGYRRTAWGLAVYYVEGLWPRPGELDPQSDLTKFHAEYGRRAFHESKSIEGLAIGVAHSHPVGCATIPSYLDDDMDAYFAKELASFSAGRPYCSLIFERSPDTGLNFSGRIHDRGHWLPVVSLFGVGDQVRQYQSQLHSPGQETIPGAEATTARLRSLMGAPSAVRLRAATVGVVGCSGTGSPAIESLARAHVGNFVLVDPERLAASNLERVHGSEWKHLDGAEMPYKAALMRDMILAINPNARIEPFVGNVLHSNVMDELVRCDLVLGCTDSVHGRVALDELSRHHLVPVIDVGVRMAGKDGRICEQLIDLTALNPNLPCVFCREKVNTYDMNYELLSDAERNQREQWADEAAQRGEAFDQYWQGRPRQLHTVGYLTTTAGALVGGYALGMLTGAFKMPHADLQFDIGCERFGVVVPPPERSNVECPCRAHIGWGDAAKPFTNVALPKHWASRAVRLHAREGAPR
jgi:hypothetical protein